MQNDTEQEMSSPDNEDWEHVAAFTSRLRVPGGWLYRYQVFAYQTPTPLALAFVPGGLASDHLTKECQHCGELFDAGAGTGRRRDAKFCCGAHQIAFNSLKRSDASKR